MHGSVDRVGYDWSVDQGRRVVNTVGDRVGDQGGRVVGHGVSHHGGVVHSVVGSRGGVRKGVSIVMRGRGVVGNVVSKRGGGRGEDPGAGTHRGHDGEEEGHEALWERRD